MVARHSAPVFAGARDRIGNRIACRRAAVSAYVNHFGVNACLRQLVRRPGQKESRWVNLLTDSDEAATAPPHSPSPHASPGTADVGATSAREPEPEPEINPGAEPEPRSLEVHNPATGELVRSVAVTDEREIEQKVERARRAQPAWAARTYDERADALRRFRALLEAEADECAHITTREMGIDGVEIRKRNLIPAEAIPYKTPSALTYDSGDFPTIFDKALKFADWDGYADRKRQSEAGETKVR